MSQNVPQRPLEQMGIAPEVILPEGVLTPSKAKSVRFSQTRPGYHYEEVEEFVSQVQSSLDQYVNILHGRDLDIYKLDEALARAYVDLANKDGQIEVLLAQGGIVQANVDDSEVALLLETNARIVGELEALKTENERIREETVALNTWAEEAEIYISKLEASSSIQPSAVEESQYEDVVGNESTYDESDSDNYQDTDEPDAQSNRQSNPAALPPGIRLDDLE